MADETKETKDESTNPPGETGESGGNGNSSTGENKPTEKAADSGSPGVSEDVRKAIREELVNALKIMKPSETASTESPRAKEQRIAEEVNKGIMDRLGELGESLKKVQKKVEESPKKVRKLEKFFWGAE